MTKITQLSTKTKFPRLIKKQILKKFFKGRAIILVGARRVGKSTLVNTILKKHKKLNPDVKIKSYNCDDPDDIELLNNRGLEYLKGLFDKTDIIFIDEAQKLPTISSFVKLLVDYYKEKKQIIITGSSSINLLDHTTEPLTGRKFVFNLFPLSYEEADSNFSTDSFLKKKEQLLLYGLYPEIYSETDFSLKKDFLDELTDSYLYKDILEFQKIKNPTLLRDLLKALAIQIGSLVSYNELSSLLGIDKNTVIHYIDLLEKNFIIYRLPSYKTNKRREIGHSKKIYFWDLGIRNELINDFRELRWRTDVGALWENFCINERLKHQSYHKTKTNNYFWRTYDGVEVNFVEEYPEKLKGFEFKWNPKKLPKSPKKWQDLEKTTYKVISPKNFFELLKKQ